MLHRYRVNPFSLLCASWYQYLQGTRSCLQYHEKGLEECDLPNQIQNEFAIHSFSLQQLHVDRHNIDAILVEVVSPNENKLADYCNCNA